ncbi:MAG: LysR family transcriptional regulator [Gammaproteobacteria bacterium]|nr:LysR family transcriptional regulator [Gammaproteobacteria bacterium]
MEYSKLPDLKFLATLQAVVERGGVNEAALTLNIGQPAVTKRLRALEEIYEVELMERVSGRLQLTEAGKLVYQFAAQTLEYGLALESALANLRLGRKTLRLEVTMAIGEHFLSGWLVRFTDAYPEYRVESRLAYGRLIEPHLATGQTDLAVMENAPDHPDVLVQKWRDDEILLVCGRSHPYARRQEVSQKELESLSFVLREKNAALREYVDNIFRTLTNFRPEVAMEVGSTAAIMNILLRGRHVSFLPRFAVTDLVVKGDLVVLKVENLQLKRTLWIARNRMHLEHPVAQAFIDMLHQE